MTLPGTELVAKQKTMPMTPSLDCNHVTTSSLGTRTAPDELSTKPRPGLIPLWDVTGFDCKPQATWADCESDLEEADKSGTVMHADNTALPLKLRRQASCHLHQEALLQIGMDVPHQDGMRT